MYTNTGDCFCYWFAFFVSKLKKRLLKTKMILLQDTCVRNFNKNVVVIFENFTIKK